MIKPPAGWMEGTPKSFKNGISQLDLIAMPIKSDFFNTLKPKQKLINKIMHTTNGNIVKKSISIIQWNKGNSFVRNTIDRLK